MRILIISIASFIFYSSNAWSQTWGSSTFSQTINEANDIETNNLGEHYVAGHYSGQTSFGTTVSISSSQGNTDAYIAKYNAVGEILWVKNFGGILADRAVDLVVGTDQTIIVTGHYFGTVNFGGTTLTSAGNSKDIFLLKLDPSGNVLWAKSEGGTSADNSNKVTVDSQNNIILTGEFQGTSTIAGTSLTSTINPLNSSSSFDFFVAKYTPAGTPVWVRTGQANNDDKGMSVAVDNANNIFVTGQFSNDMTFGGSTYTNVSLNIGFVSKLDANGTVLYFNILRAGLVLPYDIKLNSNNEPILTGDFQGNLNYIHGGTTTTITNPYSKKIFTIKTSNTGQHIWNNTLGSNNELSARALSIDPANQIYITGFFKCDLSQIQDTTENLFNSVGFRDPYLMKLSNSGARINIKHFGGKQEDEGKGVSSRVTNRPIVCGTFTSDLNFQSGGSVNLGFDNYTFSQFFAPSDPSFVFLTGDLSRNSFLTSHIDNNYGNYNYFKIPGADSLEGYIRNLPGSSLIYANDTIHFCDNAELYYETQTWPYYGPDYTFSWSAGSTGQTQPIFTQGNYWVTVTRVDGCAVEMDSIFAKKEPIPNLPLMTDNHGYNTNQMGPLYNNIELCHPDSPIVQYSNLDPGTTMVLQGQDDVFNGTGPHHLVNDSTYLVIVSNQYCSAIGSFEYFQYLNIPPDLIDLSIVPDKPVLPGDTIKICLNDYVEFHGIDLITNPLGNFNPQLPQPYDTLIWHIDGGFMTNYDTATTYISPMTSGWHSIQLDVLIGYDNFCGTDTTTYTITKNYYIQILPAPGSGITISGGNELCPNSSEILVASMANPNLHWTGANIVWNNGADSIEVNAPGWYNYNGMLVDPISGCSNYVAVNHYVSVKVPPVITLLPGDGVICPNDSLKMTVSSSYTSYLWINQNGDTISTSNICFTDDPGYYMCRVIDASGCSMWTVPVDVFEYATPTFSVSPNAALCAGEAVEVELNFSGNASFQWQNLPTNNNPVTISTPGTYFVQISQCGTTSIDSIVIIDASINPTITVSDSVLCFGDTAHFVGSIVASYDWMNGMNTTQFYSTVTSGSYFATVTNSYGCSAQTNTINIVTIPPSSTPSVPSHTICSGDDVTLTEDNSTPLNWYSMDSTLLFTGASINLTNIISDTSYLVSYTTSNSECGISYQQVNVTFIATLESFQVHGDSILCQGENGTFTATTTDPVEWFINGNSIGTSNPITIPFATLNNQQVFSVSTSNVCFTVTIQDSVEIITPTTISLSQNPVSICYKEVETVSVTNPNLTNITWSGNFGTVNGNPLTLFGNQSHTPITVSAIDQYGCPAISSILNVNTSVYTLTSSILFPNYCNGTSGMLQAVTSSDSVRWITPSGITTNVNPLNIQLSNQTNGNYILQSWDDFGCMYQDTVFVPISESPHPNFLHDTLICSNQNYVIAFPADGNTYYWDIYGNQSNFYITGDLQLILNIQNQDGCISIDTLNIHTVNCDDALPNIITPNGDGVNDFFIIDESVIQPNNRLIIFNRWGNTIFEAAPYKNDFNGFDCVEGVYFYRYFPDRDKNESESGFLTIIR